MDERVTTPLVDRYMWRPRTVPTMISQAVVRVDPPTRDTIHKYINRAQDIWITIAKLLEIDAKAFMSSPDTEKNTADFGSLIDATLSLIYDPVMAEEFKDVIPEQSFKLFPYLRELPYENARERIIDMKRAYLAAKRRALLGGKKPTPPNYVQNNNRRSCRFTKAQVTLEGDTLHIHGPFPLRIRSSVLTKIDPERIEYVTLSKKAHKNKAMHIENLTDTALRHQLGMGVVLIFVLREDE